MWINSAFDSGAIEVVDATDPGRVMLRLRADPPTDTPAGVVRFAQWFHFQVVGARGVPLTLRIQELSRSAYPESWPGYQAVVTEDRQSWRRAPTEIDGDELVIRYTPGSDAVWFSYFAPYDQERHQALIARAAACPGVRLRPVGRSLDGRLIDRLVIGEPGEGRRNVWVVARQHPGETMAEWWVEGFLERLLHPDDALAAALRGRAVIHVIPNINPDGAFRGYLRTNAAGANLNREWAAASAERSPEVLHTLAAMDESGVDLFLDVHGDEGLPYVFLAGAEGIPGWAPRLQLLEAELGACWRRVNPDLQLEEGYPPSAPGEADLSMGSNAVAHRYDCLGVTLEMPFKDNQNRPDPVHGWSPERSRRLGASAVDVFLELLPKLR